MDLATTVFVSVGLAADAFAVSVSSGMSIRNLKVNKALKIALFFGGFQALMPLLGWLAGIGLQGLMTSIDHWVAFGLLSFIGGRMIYEAFEVEECEKINPLELDVLLTLSIATSLDALAVGLSLAIIKTSILKAASTIGIITFSLSFLGVFIGNKCGCMFKNKVEIIGGLILIGIGSKILLEHLNVL